MNRLTLWLVRQLGGGKAVADQPNAMRVHHQPGCGADISKYCYGLPGPQGVQVLAPMACPVCNQAMFAASPVVRATQKPPIVATATR